MAALCEADGNIWRERVRNKFLVKRYLLLTYVLLHIYLCTIRHYSCLSGGFWEGGKPWKNSSYVWKTRTKKKARQREKIKRPSSQWVPLCSQQPNTALCLKKKKKKMSGHRAGKTIQHSHVTVLMRCHLFPSKSCCNMITPLG